LVFGALSEDFMKDDIKQVITRCLHHHFALFALCYVRPWWKYVHLT
jgi:hypothetical protein